MYPISSCERHGKHDLNRLPFVRLPAEKSILLLQENDGSTGKRPTVTTDPFLYNPRRSLNNKGNLLVVQNENLDFQITLRNPFVFDLELSSLSLRYVSDVAANGMLLKYLLAPLELPSKPTLLLFSCRLIRSTMFSSREGLWRQGILSSAGVLFRPQMDSPANSACPCLPRKRKTN